MKVKKIVVSAITATIMAFSLVAFVGCGGLNNDEDVIREALVSELDTIKNLNNETITEFTEGMDIDSLAVYGIDGIEFVKSYLNGFDYSIDSITIDGDAAEAVVTLKCKSFTGFENALKDAVNKLTTDPNVINMTESELNTYLGSVVMECINNTEVVSTQPIALSYTKDGNTWEPSAATSNDVMNAMMSN